MATSTRKIEVEILGDSRSLERSFARASRSSKEFNRDIGKATRGALAGSGAFQGLGRSLAFASGAFLGTASVTAVLKESVDAASNLAEQTNKVTAIFGDATSEVLAFGKTSAEALGISNDQALEAVGTFGNLFTTVGLTADENAKLSKSLVTLAADLASFNNASPEDTLLALRSGLVGEAEPLRRFGVLLSETRVQQEALRETGKRSVTQLTAQEKVLARYQLILRDTVPAQGDFAKTQDGLANSQRTLSAEIRDTEAAIGTALLPSVRRVTKGIRDWLAVDRNQKRIQDDVSTGVDVTTTAVRGLINAYKDLQGLGDLPGPIGTFFKVLVKPGFGVQQLGKLFAKGGGDFAKGAGGSGGGGDFRDLTGEDVGLRGAAARTPQPAGALTPQRLGLKARFSKLQLRLAQAQLTESERDDRALLELEAKNLKDQLARRKLSLKEQIALTEQLVAVEDQISGIDKRSQDRIEEARRKRREQARQARERRRQQQENRQFRALGLGPEGAALVPTQKALRRELGTVESALKGTFLDTNATRSVLAKIRKLMSGQLGALSADVRSVVKQMLDDLKGQLTEFDGFNLTKAEKRRRFLDKQLSGPVGGGGRKAQPRGGNTVNVHQTIVAAPGESADSLARRQHFRAKQAFAH